MEKRCTDRWTVLHREIDSTLWQLCTTEAQRSKTWRHQGVWRHRYQHTLCLDSPKTALIHHCFGGDNIARNSEAEFTATCMLSPRVLWKLVTGSSAGLGRQACVPEEEKESEDSEELLGEVRKNGHSRQRREHGWGPEGPDAERGWCSPAGRTTWLEPRGQRAGRARGCKALPKGLAKNGVLRAIQSFYEECKQERERWLDVNFWDSSAAVWGWVC